MVPRNLILKEKGRRQRCQPEEELVSQEDILHSCDNLSNLLEGETEAKTIIVNDWQNHTLTRTAWLSIPLALYLNLNLMPNP